MEFGLYFWLKLHFVMPSRDQFTTEIYVNNEQARDALSKLNTQLEKF